MATEQPKEELVLPDGLARVLVRDWGYSEVTRQNGHLKLKNPWYKDNPLTGSRYDFDYWQLCKEEKIIDIWNRDAGKKIPKRFVQFWLENPYFGIRLREASAEVVASQLMNMLSPNSGKLENIELQKAMSQKRPYTT